MILIESSTLPKYLALEISLKSQNCSHRRVTIGVWKIFRRLGCWKILGNNNTDNNDSNNNNNDINNNKIDNIIYICSISIRFLQFLNKKC